MVVHLVFEFILLILKYIKYFFQNVLETKEILYSEYLLVWISFYS